MKYPEKYRKECHTTHMHHFLIPFEGRELSVFASNWGGGWEHVSVSLKNRCPNWREMCLVKNLFWNDDEECIQFHPKESEYINLHNYCLHIWKPPIEVSQLLDSRMDLKSLCEK